MQLYCLLCLSVCLSDYVFFAACSVVIGAGSLVVQVATALAGQAQQ